MRYVTVAGDHFALSALVTGTLGSWGGAPGFYISRLWRLVDRFHFKLGHYPCFAGLEPDRVGASGDPAARALVVHRGKCARIFVSAATQLLQGMLLSDVAQQNVIAT